MSCKLVVANVLYTTHIHAHIHTLLPRLRLLLDNKCGHLFHSADSGSAINGRYFDMKHYGYDRFVNPGITTTDLTFMRYAHLANIAWLSCLQALCQRHDVTTLQVPTLRKYRGIYANIESERQPERIAEPYSSLRSVTQFCGRIAGNCYNTRS